MNRHNTVVHCLIVLKYCTCM